MAGSPGFTQCPSCASVVPDAADHCPHCGARLKGRSSIWEKIGKGLAATLLGLLAIVFGAAGACFLLVGSSYDRSLLLIGAVLFLLAYGAGRGAYEVTKKSNL